MTVHQFILNQVDDHSVEMKLLELIPILLHLQFEPSLISP
jgi:hypothetical protein